MSAENHIQHIVEQMRSLQWERGRSAKALARELQIPLSTVQNWSSIASKLVRESFSEDRDDHRADMLLALDKATQIAVKANDAKALVQAAKVRGTATGVYSEKLSLDATINPSSVNALDDDALLWLAIFGEAKPKPGQGSGRPAGYYVAALEAYQQAQRSELEKVRVEAEALDLTANDKR